MALGFELRASNLLGTQSMACATPAALFALVILEVGLRFLPTLSETLLFYASRVAVKVCITMHNFFYI
jgi:hypothetical protein